MEKAKDQAKDIGLQVFKINQGAKEFYEHHGFQVQGETQTSIVMRFSPNMVN